MTKLLLIESPGKSKKLSQILGAGWIVKASMGHIRELAQDGEDSLGFDLEDDRINCRYEIRGDRSKKVISDLRQAVKQATDIYIATDPDREGETIGWHLAQELRLKQPKRVTYTEITKAAVMSAIAKPRTLDQNLIAAGRARDCLDKLVGYKGSKHLVWQLKNGAKSMGRVQSATLHLICQREKEIIAFVPEDYWSVWVEYKEGFKAFYRASLKAAKDDNSEPDDAGKNDTKPESDRVKTQAEADRLVAIAKANPHSIIKIEKKTVNQSPPPPFITSSLQQAAGAKLHKSPEQTMKIAQSLYEAGHITYMRTDSVVLSEQFCDAVQKYLQANDPENVPDKTTRHRSKQGAQEAHEAIRPTDVNRIPAQLQTQLSADEANLYELIWNRAVASQCRPAQIAKTRIITQSADIFWEARGQVLIFPGYTRYWNNISEDVQLPNVVEGQKVNLKDAKSEKKQTQPPPRYTEPKLVQLMEKKGIGRPSTYSPTIKTLKEREYVQLTKSKLQPTPLGMELDDFLAKVLPDLIAAEFTAQMESQLDAIADGKQNWEKWLTNWNREYFDPALKQAIQQVKGYTATANSHNFAPAKTTGKGRKAKSDRLAEILGNENEVVKQKRTRSTDDIVPTKGTGKQRKTTADALAEILGNENEVVKQMKSRATSDIAPKKATGRRRKTTANTGNESKKSFTESTEILCPKCNKLMVKVPTKSEKVKAGHFLSCDKRKDGCGAVMFLNDKTKQYELPYGERAAKTPETKDLSEFPCPVCSLPMEKHNYADKKTGETKTMLRCSNAENRKQGCKEVAFWWTSQKHWWSPTFGEIKSKGDAGSKNKKS
ncbi:type I DNA topoisomerase [Aerosakkonema sp. BLCC-F183]|uniref:type I DNA topoisomerase n=1 Tax=Aerosakkonema sp. BLCC-F183 TaxID=3342834 RepID=UPI0035B88D95